MDHKDLPRIFHECAHECTNAVSPESEVSDFDLSRHLEMSRLRVIREFVTLFVDGFHKRDLHQIAEEIS